MAVQVRKRRKKGTIDNTTVKRVLIITAILIVAITSVFVIRAYIKTTKNYIGKIEDTKIYTYEFKYYFYNALSDLELGIEYPDNATQEEKDNIRSTFWTTKNADGKTPVDIAMEIGLNDAQLYKASYVISKKAGYALSSSEQKTVKTSVDATIQNYYNYYQEQEEKYGTSYTYDQIKNIVCGMLPVDQYKEISINQAAIEVYKEKVLKASYDIMESDLRNVYDENPNDYRTIKLRIFQLNKGTEPTKPSKENGTAININDTDYEQYRTIYEKYLSEYDAYIIAEQNKLNKVNSICNQINTTGNYTEQVVDEESGEIYYKYQNSDFVTLIKSESDEIDVSTTSGIFEITSETDHEISDITKFAKAANFNENRTKIISEYKGEIIGPSVEQNSEVSKVVIIETDTKYYLVRVDSIIDFDNSVESKEDAADSIKDIIKTNLMKQMADDDMKELVKEEKYQINDKKESLIEDIRKEMIATYGLY